MAEAFLDQKKSSGIKLNDVIEEFKYVYKGQTIKAGDLVNYINGVASQTEETSVNTAIDNTNTYSGYRMSAVALDESRVFIAHCYGSNYNLYGVVCTINGTTITKGTDTQLSSTQWSGISLSACLLSNGNVFIAHSYGTSYNLYGLVVSINGTTITKGTDKKLSSEAQTGKATSVCLLSDGNVLIAHSYSTNYKLYGIIVKINDTTVTAGTDTVLNSNTYTGMGISANLLPNGNVFIAHSYNSDYYLYGMICTISGTTIAVATNTALNNSTTYTGAIISTCLLPSGSILLVHGYSTSYKLYGMVCNINGTTITKGTDTQLNSTSNTGQRISTCLLPNNNVLITHNYSGDYMLYGMVATVNGTTITKGTDIELNNTTRASEWISSVLLPNGTIFIAHSYDSSYYLHAQIWGINESNIPTNNVVITEYEQQVTPAIEPPFNAIALSSGVGGTDTEHNEQVKIARLPVEILNTGNLFPTNWVEVVKGTEYTSNNYRITASSYSSDSTYVSNASNGILNEPWASSTSQNSWIKIELPKAIRITQMKIHFNAVSEDYISSATIQGSNNDSSWVDLGRITHYQTSLETIELDNTDFYKYYRIYITLTTSSKAFVYEWQTAEYVEVI